MTINGISYASLGSLNIKGQSSVKGSALRFARTSSTSPFDSTSYGIYVNSSGSFVIKAASVASGTAALTITAGDLTITSGYLVISANAKGITFTGTGANGGVLKNLKNSAATALSGTQKDIEIDIGGTPYYFTVYPTKA